MFDMSWGEVMVIGAVALIVIGPKDLPKALRTVGNMVAKMRRMAGEFQTQFNDAMREAELDEIRKQVEGVNQSVPSLTTGFNPFQTVRDELKGAIERPVGPASSAPLPDVTPQPANVDPAPAVASVGEPPSFPVEPPAATSGPAASLSTPTVARPDGTGEGGRG